MIDTIILNIPREKVTMLSPEGARVSAWDLQSRTAAYEKYVKNPTARDRQEGIYRPRLTGFKRRTSGGMRSDFLKIEFSAPKMLYGENLSEVREAQFATLVSVLQERLLGMGVVVGRHCLEGASVSSFHPSKNIPLGEGYTAAFAISELAKIDLSQKFDLTKISFRNGGQSLQGYAKAHSVVFYDKLADLAQPKARAVDKDQTKGQLSLFRELKRGEPQLEILRLEVRLSQKQKMNAVLKAVGEKVNPTFREIFRRGVCQKIVRRYWDTLVCGENLFLFGVSDKPQGLLRQIIRSRPGIKAKEAVYLVGLSVLCRDSGGVRSLRRLIVGQAAQRSWYRISKSLKTLNRLARGTSLHGWVGQIEASIEGFSPYRISRGPPGLK